MPVDFTVRIGGTTRLLPERLEALEDLIEEFREEGLDGTPPCRRGPRNASRCIAELIVISTDSRE